MSIIDVYVGLDYANSVVQVCVMDRDGNQLVNRKCDNDARAIHKIATRHGKNIQAAIESCSGAADLGEELVHQFGWSLNLAHPGYVNRMKLNPDKSDYTDAQMLADLVRVGYVPRVWLAPEAVRDLRCLVRYRQQLVDQRRDAKLRVSAQLREHRIPSPPNLRRWTKRWLAWLDEALPMLPDASRWVTEQQIAEVKVLKAKIAMAEAQLEQQIQDDPVADRLLSLRGVGLVTACTLRAEIGEFDRFRTGKQLSRFCGLSPRNASSGQRQADAGLIKAANRRLRATLIQVAHYLARQDPYWQEFNYKLLVRGKAKCEAIAAIANRWVRRLYHEMTEDKLAA